MSHQSNLAGANAVVIFIHCKCEDPASFSMSSSAFTTLVWQTDKPKIDTVLICVFLVVQVGKGYERKPLKLVYWHSSIPGLFSPLYSSHFDQENI